LALSPSQPQPQFCCRIDTTFASSFYNFRLSRWRSVICEGFPIIDSESNSLLEKAIIGTFFLAYVDQVRVEIELRKMQYFLAIAEERSFTRAAKRCHVAQSSLSRQIAVARKLAVPLHRIWVIIPCPLHCSRRRPGSRWLQMDRFLMPLLPARQDTQPTLPQQFQGRAL
jgi:Bacterial regulatory helix-turn-helix protein, lysR family